MIGLIKKWSLISLIFVSPTWGQRKKMWNCIVNGEKNDLENVSFINEQIQLVPFKDNLVHSSDLTISIFFLLNYMSLIKTYHTIIMKM